MNKKIKQNNPKKIKDKSLYLFWKDRKFVGSIILVLIIFMFVISFLKIPILTTIHAYSVGSLFGYLSLVFYLLMLLLVIKVIFGRSWLYSLKIHLSNWSIIIIYIILVLMLGGIFNIIDNNWKDWGGPVFSKSFEQHWWKSFTNQGLSSGKTSGLLPSTNNNLGIIGYLIYAIFASCVTAIGTFFLAALFIAYIGFITFKGPLRTYIKWFPKNFKKMTKKQIQDQITEEINIRNYEKTLEVNVKKLESIPRESDKYLTTELNDVQKINFKTEEINQLENSTKDVQTKDTNIILNHAEKQNNENNNSDGLFNEMSTDSSAVSFNNFSTNIELETNNSDPNSVLNFDKKTQTKTKLNISGMEAVNPTTMGDIVKTDQNENLDDSDTFDFVPFPNQLNKNTVKKELLVTSKNDKNQEHISFSNNYLEKTRNITKEEQIIIDKKVKKESTEKNKEQFIDPFED